MEAGDLKTVSLMNARKTVSRVGAFIAGAAIIYHEVYIADTSEPLLIFLGLWLLGIPPALFFDGLRKMTAATNAAVDEVAAKVQNVLGEEGEKEPE